MTCIKNDQKAVTVIQNVHFFVFDNSTGIIINKSGKFEDLVLMIAKRQTDTEIKT